MTQSSKLKQRIRARATRTGESYATARRHVMSEIDRQRTTRTAKSASVAREATAKGTVSESKCIERTGHGFDHWFEVLDRLGASSKGHKAAAKHLKEEHQVSAWYAQAITVSYERAKGLRTLNQSCAGDFQLSVSRVVACSLKSATEALSRKAKRKRWLPLVGGELETALEQALGKARVRVGAQVNTLRYRAVDGSQVEWRLTSKPDGRASVVVTASKLSDASEVDETREQWRNAMNIFRDSLK